MTFDDFEDALDQYGSDLAGWPDALAAPARRLLEQSSQAQQALAAARQMDQGLDAMFARPVVAPAGLADRIVAGASKAPTPAAVLKFPAKIAPRSMATRPTRPPASWHPDRAGMIAAAMLVVCFVGGVITVQTVMTDTTTHESIYISAIYSDLAR